MVKRCIVIMLLVLMTLMLLSCTTNQKGDESKKNNKNEDAQLNNSNDLADESNDNIMETSGETVKIVVDESVTGDNNQAMDIHINEQIEDAFPKALLLSDSEFVIDVNNENSEFRVYGLYNGFIQKIPFSDYNLKILDPSILEIDGETLVPQSIGKTKVEVSYKSLKNDFVVVINESKHTQMMKAGIDHIFWSYLFPGCNDELVFNGHSFKGKKIGLNLSAYINGEKDELAPGDGSIYKSLNENIVRAYSDGYMEIVGEGKTSIQVEYKGLVFEIPVNVEQANINFDNIYPSVQEIIIERSKPNDIFVVYEIKEDRTVRDITELVSITIDDTSVAFFSDVYLSFGDYEISGIKRGKTSLGIKVGDQIRRLPVQVVDKELPDSLVVYSDSVLIQDGIVIEDASSQNPKIKTLGMYGEKETMLSEEPYYQIKNRRIAEINDGTIVAKTKGETTLYISYGDIHMDIGLAVIDDTLDEPEKLVTSRASNVSEILSLDNEIVINNVGDYKNLLNEVYFIRTLIMRSGHRINNISFEIADESIAFLDGNNLVGKSIGKTKIKVFNDGLCTEFPVNVLKSSNVEESSLEDNVEFDFYLPEISDNKMDENIVIYEQFYMGKTIEGQFDLKVSGQVHDLEKIDDLELSSSDSSVFKINKNSSVDVIGEGTAILQVKYLGNIKIYKIEVKPLDLRGQRIRLSEEMIEIEDVNKLTSLKVLLDNDGEEIDIVKAVDFVSDNPNIVGVTRDGQVEARSIGETTIGALVRSTGKIYRAKVIVHNSSQLVDLSDEVKDKVIRKKEETPHIFEKEYEGLYYNGTATLDKGGYLDGLSLYALCKDELIDVTYDSGAHYYLKSDEVYRIYREEASQYEYYKEAMEIKAVYNDYKIFANTHEDNNSINLFMNGNDSNSIFVKGADYLSDTSKEIDEKSIDYKSSDENIFVVKSNGQIEAMNKGKAILTIFDDKESVDVNVTVTTVLLSDELLPIQTTN